MSIRTIIKLGINIFDKLTSWLPTNQIDVLFIVDFPGDDKLIANQFAGYNIKIIEYNNKKIFQTAFYARRSKVIYVDNMNIVISTISNLKGTVIQYWHATSAIKKFGLSTVKNEKEIKMRKREFKNYDLFTVNSKFMEKCFIDGFNISSEQLREVGTVQSNALFEINKSKFDGEYIVYVPTFRKDDKFNEGAIEFISSFKSNHYKLIYSLHPKVEANIENPQTIRVDSQNIRSYFTDAKLIISDYSSLLIDASLKNPNVVMYGYDINEYRKSPGLYIDEHNFWGFFTYSHFELIDYIESQSYITHDIKKIEKEYFTFDGPNSEIKIAELGHNILSLN